MDFFNSLPLDLKLLVVAIAGCTLLALITGNQKSEKRYMVVLAVLTAVGVYRFSQIPSAEDTAAAPAPANFVKEPPKKPLVSTFAK